MDVLLKHHKIWLTRIGPKPFGRISSDTLGSKYRNRNKIIECLLRNVTISNPGRNNLDGHMPGNMKPPDLELI